MSGQDYTEHDKHEDIKVLHSMGYAQELERRLSRFSNFAVSFSIICILSGGINSLAQATSGAGGIGIGIGWLVGCFVSLAFAVAMSQISSAYPTAGGLYHWGSILGNRGTGWVTAWLNLLGLITVLGAINVGTWTFFIGAFGPTLGIENNLTTQTIFLVIITGAQALINHLGIKLTAKLTDFSGYLIFGGSILIAHRLPARRPRPGISAGSSPSHNYSGEAGGKRLAVRLELPGCSRSACCCRSTRSPATTPRRIRRRKRMKAAHSVPRAMVMSVVWSAIFGYLFLAAFVLMIPNMDEAAEQGWNVFFWAFDQRVSPVVKEIVYLVVFVAQLLCGLATVTSASRMIFAFSRDGGLPGSAALAKVSPKYRTPVAAIWTAPRPVGAVRLGLVAGLGRRHLGLHDRRVVHGHLPVPVLHRPDRARPAGLGHAEVGQDGPWNLGRGVFTLFAVLSIAVDDPDLRASASSRRTTGRSTSPSASSS